MILSLVQFAQPGLFAAAAAAALIPLIIHLINRRRHRRVTWAAMQLLLAAVKRSSRRIQMEQWSLLLLRMTLLLLLGLLLARPFFRQSALGALPGARAHHILVLDNSGSMLAKVGTEAGDSGASTRRVDRARQLAIDLVRQLPEADSVSLITAAWPATSLLGYECFDRRLVHDQLQSVQPTARQTDLGSALQLAAQLVEESSAAPGNRMVYVISDHAAAAWTTGHGPSGSAESPVGPSMTPLADSESIPTTAAASPIVTANRLSEFARLLLVRVVPAGMANEAKAQIALTDIEAGTSLFGVNVPLQFEAKVRNFGQTAARGATLQIKKDEQLLREIPLEVVAGGDQLSVPFSVVFSQSGSHGLQLSLQGATTPLDESVVRRLSCRIPDQVNVLLVDGQPGATPLTGQSGYLVTALRAFSGQDRHPLFQTATISGPELTDEVLSEHDLIVLTGVARLPETTWDRLHDFVRRGGALAVFPGEGMDLDLYNQFGLKNGAGCLPGFLSEERVAGPEHSGVFHIDRQVPVHPLSADFAGQAQNSLFQARIAKYVVVRPFESASADGAAALPWPAHSAEVALNFDSGDPALVTRRFGLGTSALFASSANMDWNNLPAKGDFVSLILNLAAFVRPSVDATHNLEAGSPFRALIPILDEGSAVRLLTPDRASTEIQTDCTDLPCSITSPGLDQLGFYSLEANQRREAIAVNFPAAEADLTPWPTDEAAKALAPAIEMVDDATTLVTRLEKGRTTEVGAPLLYGVLVLLLAESWLAMRYGIHR